MRDPEVTWRNCASAALLGGDGEMPVAARIIHQSADALEIETTLAIPPGVAVKVETEDVLVLAEAESVYAIADGYRARLKVRHTLASLRDLERLNRSILGRRDSGPREGGSKEDRLLRSASE